MSRHRFSKGQKFVWKGVPYSVLQHRDSKINIEDFSGTIMTVEYGILVQALFSGELRFAIAGKHSKEDSSTGLSTECKYEDWDSCPSHLKEVARYREEAIKPLLLLDPRKRTREHFEARVAELHARQSGEGRRGLLGAVSIVSLYQWLKDFEQSGRDERALIPDFQKCGAKGKSRLAHEVEVIIQAVIDDKYMVPEKVTAEDVHREIAARIAEQNQFSPENLRLRIPSLRTIYRRINELDTVDLYATKHGARAARQKIHAIHAGRT